MSKIVKDEYQVKIYEAEYCVIIFTGSSLSMNAQDDNVDIEVVLNNGKRYSGTIVTLKNIQSVMEKDKVTGEFGNGLYFGGCKDLVIVESLDFDIIEKLVRSVYDDRLIDTVFCFLGTSSEKTMGNA